MGQIICTVAHWLLDTQIICTVAHWLLDTPKKLREPTPAAHKHQDGASHHQLNPITPTLNTLSSSSNSSTNLACPSQTNSPYSPLTSDLPINSTSDNDTFHHEPKPVKPPQVHFLSITNSPTNANAASSSQKKTLCPTLTYNPHSNPSSYDDDIDDDDDDDDDIDDVDDSDDDDDSAPGMLIPEKFKIQVTCVKWMKHYRSDHKILLVGEGDFSFSASLAEAFCSATNLTATSLDSFGFLVRNYRNAVSNIVALKNYGATVLHEVDATKMANLSPFKYMRPFDRVVYNFPLAGFFPNQPREDKIRLNQSLVKLFLENAKKLIDINGEIHITHKCYGFFLEWDLEALASSVGLRLREEVHFNLSDYPGYNTKYGFGGDKNFDCDPSKTYKFVHKNPFELEDFM